MSWRPALLTLPFVFACSAGGGSDDELAGTTSASTSGETTTSESGSTSETTGPSDSTSESESGSETGEPEPEYWQPGMTLPTPRSPNARGLLDRRGLVHAHSVHSHDACDDNPKDAQGNYDTTCDRDFREGLCRARHDFVFLTDHPATFSEVEYPDTLLYRPDWGDELVEDGGSPIANWAGCEGFDAGLSGSAPFVPALLMAGSESDTMPVGLPAHVAATPAERDAIYNSATPEAIMALRDAGAVALVAHTENWTAQELVDLPLQGFEMYNVHANLFANIAAVGQLMIDLGSNDGVPHPDLVLFVLMSEEPDYIDTWAAVLANEVERVATIGTDCHRNTFQQLLSDGQRIDSYERLMKWFGNHLLIEPDDQGEWGLEQAREALAAGRLYGVFEFLGHPEGFAYLAEQNADVHEMGSVLSLAQGSTVLRVVAPIVMARDPATPAPDVQLRILRADASGWQEVALAEGSEGQLEDLVHEVGEPGAYRAEVRLRAHHLAGQLGKHEALLDEAAIWVYSNPIYVRE